jgi:plasmid stabilization system protein ParE
MGYKIRWSPESLENLDLIFNDIETKWSPKEVDKFKSKLSHFLSLVSKFPHLYPFSKKHPELRKAVISKQTTVIYSVDSSWISILRVELNKMRL